MSNSQQISVAATVESITARADDAKRSLANNTSSTNSSTTPSNIYQVLNVQPPTTGGPRWLRRWVWKLHGMLLPLLHLGDPSQARDNNVNLRVLWNKAISSLDPRSPAYENENEQQWTWDMLPSYSRWVLLRLVPIRFFPRWLHANIELRTVYLDRAIGREIRQQTRNNSNIQIRIIVFGGGYDTRCVRLLNSNNNRNNNVRDKEVVVVEAWELDLPQVVDSKRIMLQRLCRRQKQQQTVLLPQLKPVDLNDLVAVHSTLESILSDKKNKKKGRRHQWHTIFVSEAVLMNLNEDVPQKLLRLCSEMVRKTGGTSSSFCFADRLFEPVPTSKADDGRDDDNENDAEMIRGRQFFLQAKWTMVDWMIKPGRACHMGVARR